MTKSNIKEFISGSTYSTVYLPIHNKTSNDIFAYEALSKFIVNDTEVSCYDFFSKMSEYEKLFFLLEKKNKQHQINNANMKKKLILYFDVVVFKKKEYRTYWRDFLLPFRDNIIIAITPHSNYNKDDKELNKKLFKWLKKNSFEFMVSIFDSSSFELLGKEIEKANYLKINKRILSIQEKNKSYVELLHSLINFSKLNNTKTLIKHIDNTDELEQVNKFDFDFIQKTF